jgi:phytoene dehydrogenase-like protein
MEEIHMKPYDVAIIGGGISGLVAAIDLAMANKSVIVLEKSAQMGGRAITINKNGSRFNLGGHALYRSGEAYAILQQLNLKLEGGTPPSSGMGIWRNQLVPLPGDLLKLLSSRLLSMAGKIELGRLMLSLGKWDAAAIANISLREWSEQAISDPMVRHIFYALCRTATYSRDLDYQQAGSVVRQVQRSLKEGVLYLHGGWQTIVDQLRELAIRNGVALHNSSNVSEIKHDGSVRGVQLNNGQYLFAHHVISTLSPAETYRLVHDAERTALKRWKEDARPITAACLDLSLKRLPVAGRHFAIGLDQPVYFSNHSNVAELSDNGASVMHLIKYSVLGESDPKADEQLLEQTMGLLHPNWQKEVVAKQYLPNITVVHDYMHLGRKDPLPGPAVPEISGLYVAGDWASHGEMLLDAAVASAKRASQHILAKPSVTPINYTHS